MDYRVKLIIHFDGVADAHFWHAPTLPEAETIKSDLAAELTEVKHSCFIYADTSLGHIRVR